MNRHGLDASGCRRASELTWMRLADHLSRLELDAIGDWLETTADAVAVRMKLLEESAPT